MLLRLTSEFATYIADYAGGYPYGTFPRYTQSVIDTSSVSVRYNNNTPFHPVFSHIDTGTVYSGGSYEQMFLACFTKPQRVVGFKIVIPFILPGDSVIIEVAKDNCCYQAEEIGCGSANYYGSLYYSGKYTDPCGLQSAIFRITFLLLSLVQVM